ncbi:hypothetical protein [Sphingobium sp. WCS2017Hpa-17]|uniref:hypothetical protein n=1 Tax=Sphingobium sp. WCS2017Hpa-17 TaxID=3073638 RepID=UPI0028893A22|nr:hypothetical protein [Sphingobium sp. WCS2017Hpa-17]
MTENHRTLLDAAFDNMANDFANSLKSLSGEPVVQAGLIGPALACLVVSLENAFPDCTDVLAHELQRQADIAQDEQRRRPS